MKVVLGWAAPTIAEQFPQLPPSEADHFQRDHTDLLRLKVRRILTDAEHKRAVSRFCKHLSTTLAELKGEDRG